MTIHTRACEGATRNAACVCFVVCGVTVDGTAVTVEEVVEETVSEEVAAVVVVAVVVSLLPLTSNLNRLSTCSATKLFEVTVASSAGVVTACPKKVMPPIPMVKGVF